MLWSPTTVYRPEPFGLESDLEKALKEVLLPLFGPNRIYLDTKRLIGAKGSATSQTGISSTCPARGGLGYMLSKLNLIDMMHFGISRFSFWSFLFLSLRSPLQ